MAPELFSLELAQELQALGQRVKDYQVARKLTNAELKTRFPQIGSDSTLGKILKLHVAELDLDAQLRAYREVVRSIEAIGESDLQGDTIYGDLWPAAELLRVFQETIGETGNARAIFLLGPSGSGKTCARTSLIGHYPGRFLCVEASSAWKGSPMAYLGMILRALGEVSLPYSQVDRLELVVEKLKKSRRDIITEEAHHLGPDNLNVQVTLINRTPSIFVNVAIPSLWRKLMREAYEEVVQLTGNRLAEVIQLSQDVEADDVELLLEKRVKWANGDLPVAHKRLMETAVNHGRLAFVRDAIKRANQAAGKRAVTREDFAKAIVAEIKSREVRR